MLIISKISKFCAPLLALMVLVSSMTYNVDFHYCQGQLKSFSIFGKAKNCHEMASKMPSCHHKKKNQENTLSCSEGENNCCSNKIVNLEADFDKTILNIDLLNQEYLSVVVANTSFSFKSFFIERENEIPFAHYKPPLIQKDIPVLFETFLL